MMLLKIVGKWFGWHRWIDAPEKYEALSVLHSHEFVFEALIEVTGDREVEFLELANESKGELETFLFDHPGSSCETLATQLFRILHQKNLGVYSCAVLEDGMCGAVFVPSHAANYAPIRSN